MTPSAGAEEFLNESHLLKTNPSLIFITAQYLSENVRAYKIGRLGEPSSVIFHMFSAGKIIKTKEAIMKFY